MLLVFTYLDSLIQEDFQLYNGLLSAYHVPANKYADNVTLADLVISAAAPATLFGVVSESVLTLRNVTFYNVALCVLLEFSRLFVQNARFEGYLCDNASASEIQLSFSDVARVSGALVDCRVLIHRSVLKGVAGSVSSRAGAHASEIYLTECNVSDAFGDIFASRVKIANGSVGKCAENVEDSTVVLDNITVMQELLFAVVDLESVIVLYRSRLAGFRIAQYLVSRSYALVYLCSHEGATAKNSYFGSVQDLSELYFLDCSFEDVVAADGGLFAEEINKMQFFSLLYCNFRSISASSLIADEVLGLANLTIHYSSIIDVPVLFQHTDSFFIYITESKVQQHDMKQSLVCIYCENGALYIFRAKLLLQAREPLYAGGLVNQTFSVQVQLKMSRFDVYNVSEAISRDLTGYLLIESCYFAVSGAKNGLIAEMYAAGALFDCIFDIQASNGLLFGEKMTSVPVTLQDVYFFDAQLSGCLPSRARSSRQKLIDDFVCAGCSDFPEWFFGFDEAPPLEKGPHSYSEETIRWVYQFCGRPEDFSSSAKYIVKPGNYAGHLAFDSELEDQYRHLAE